MEVFMERSDRYVFIRTESSVLFQKPFIPVWQRLFDSDLVYFSHPRIRSSARLSKLEESW